MKTRLVRVALLVLGVAVLGALVVTTGSAAILSAMARLSWRLVVFVFFPFVLVTLFDTLGWRFAFIRDRVRFRTLVWARLAGEAFNLTTPTAALGGEAVKAWLLSGYAPRDETVSSVIVAKTTITLAQGLFLALGIVVAWVFVPSDSLLLRAMLWLVCIELVAIGAFAVAQRRGIGRRTHRLVQWAGLRVPVSGELLSRLDENLADYYGRRPRRLILSLGFHFVAWCLGSLETYIALRWLGTDVSFATATVIEAFGTAIRFATFFIPASVGVLEGGYVLIFSALGLTPALAISFGLMRRLRELAWIAAGLVAFVAGPMLGAPRVSSPQPESVREDASLTP